MHVCMYKCLLIESGRGGDYGNRREKEAAESGGSRSDRSKQDFNDPEEGSSYSDSIPTLETTHTVLYPWTPILLTTALRMCSVRIDSGRDAMRWYGMVWYGKR